MPSKDFGISVSPNNSKTTVDGHVPSSPTIHNRAQEVLWNHLRFMVRTSYGYHPLV